jgi:hypothetical protein
MSFRTTVSLALTILMINLSGPADIAQAKTSAKNQTQSIKTQANIDGFRSASFGMKEKDVYKAIRKDFKISKGKVSEQVHPLEQTKSLEIKVPALLAVGGDAKIGYIFGYKSKRLMQINVIWGTAVTKVVDGQGIVNTANFLRTHLMKKEYKKEGFVANTRINDSLTIVLRGQDKKNRMALLTLATTKTPKDKDGKQTINNMSLKLSYMHKPNDPDILTIKDGDF